jgi:putative endonuclease
MAAGMARHRRHPGLDPGSALFFASAVFRQPCAYLLARAYHSTFYTGVTSDLVHRLHQHRQGLTPGITTKYRIKRLVWFEMHETMEAAIVREKQIKRWRRQWKYDLINELDPGWRDLAEDFGFDALPLGQERRTRARGRGDG